MNVEKSTLESFRGFDGEFAMDTLERTASYILMGNNGSQIKLSGSARQLLQAVRKGMSFEEIANAINTSNQNAVTKEQLEAAYSKLIRQLADIEESSAKYKLPWGFWIKFRIVPARLACKIASCLSFLYDVRLFSVLFACVAFAGFALFHHGLRLQFKDSAVLPAYFIFLGTLILHEFGHAAACSRFGAEPSDIGFTIYLIYPAFYSDVSSAWRLTRWQRVAVDLGGNYFQFVAGALLACSYYATHWEPFRLAIVMIIYSAVFSLNPILKFDGYWVAADMLGVSNLTQQPIRIMRYLLALAFRKPTKPLPWPKWITGVLIVYSAASLGVWTLFVWRLFPTVGGQMLRFGRVASAIWHHVLSKEVPQAAEIRMFIISMLFVLISVTMCWNLGMQLLQPLLRRLLPSGQ